MSNLKDAAISGAKWNGISSIVSFVLGLIQVGVLSRYLSPAEIGLYSIILVVLAFSGFFGDLGVSNAIIHFQKMNETQIRTLYWVNVISAILFTLIIYYGAPFVAQFYNEESLTDYLRLAILSLLCFAIGQNYFMQFRKALRFKLIAVISILQRVVVFVVMLVLLIQYQLGLYAVIYGMLAGALFFGITYFGLGITYFSTPFRWDISISESRESLQFGFYHMADNVVSHFSSILDKIVIGKLFGVSQLGYYEYATVLTNRPITLINPVFNAVGFPIFSKIQDNHQKLNDWYIKMVGLIALIMAPIYFGYFAVGDGLVELYLGRDWDETAHILHFIFILGYFYSISNPIGSYILALGRPDIALKFSIYQIIVYGLLYYMGSFYSFDLFLVIFISGAILLTVPVEYYLRYHLTSLSPLRFARATLVPLFYGGFMALVLLFVESGLVHAGISTLHRFLMEVVVGALLYGFILVLFEKEKIQFYFGLLRNRK